MNVELRHPLESSVERTILYTPDEPPPAARPGTHSTTFEVVNETTLTGARALVEAGHRVAALNFASAKNPGGFLGGSEAQEESLARASALYACLTGSPFYEHHRARRDPAYSDHVIYSPDVPVFRDDGGALLDAHWPCSFVTAAAVNRGAMKGSTAGVGALMRSRMACVLDAMVAHEHEAIVLGAWGCGVFRNDPQEIAELFREALTTTHRGAFARVRFSVLDRGDRGTYRAFAARF